MSSRVVFDGRDDFEAVSLVERRRLERERHEHDLRAAAATRLLLGSPEQLRTEPAVALRLFHPKLPQLTGTAPGVPADPRHDALLIAHEEREPFAIGDASGARVELVNPIFQILHVVWRRVDRTERDLTHFAYQVAGPPVSSRRWRGIRVRPSFSHAAQIADEYRSKLICAPMRFGADERTHE